MAKARTLIWWAALLSFAVSISVNLVWLVSIYTSGDFSQATDATQWLFINGLVLWEVARAGERLTAAGRAALADEAQEGDDDSQ